MKDCREGLVSSSLSRKQTPERKSGKALHFPRLQRGTVRCSMFRVGSAVPLFGKWKKTPLREIVPWRRVVVPTA